MTDQEIVTEEMLDLMNNYQTSFTMVWLKFLTLNCAEDADMSARVLLRITERYVAELVRQVKGTDQVRPGRPPSSGELDQQVRDLHRKLGSVRQVGLVLKIPKTRVAAIVARRPSGGYSDTV